MTIIYLLLNNNNVTALFVSKHYIICNSRNDNLLNRSYRFESKYDFNLRRT